MRYKNMREAGCSNFDLLLKMFGRERLLEPKSEYCVYDGIIKDEPIYIIAEVKRREFTNEKLLGAFRGTFFLEKKKFDSLHSERNKLSEKHKQIDFKIHYICETSDGITYTFDLTDSKYDWTEQYMKRATYVSNRRVTKLVAHLHISKSIKIEKL